MSSNKFVWAVALLAVCIVTVAACPSYGESVAIVNAGFEEPDAPADGWEYMLTNMGWSFCGGNWDIFVQDWASWAPEGEQYGHAPYGQSYAPLSGFAQLLDATLQADLTYTLSAQVGNDDSEQVFGAIVSNCWPEEPKTPTTSGRVSGIPAR